jgi:hypothetical protein
MNPTTIANSGGTATTTGNTTTFSGITSVSLNGVFNSSHTNYSVLIDMVGTVDASLRIRLRAAGSDTTSSLYSTQTIEGLNATAAASAAISNSSFAVDNLRTLKITMQLYFYGPQVTTITQIGSGFNTDYSAG